MVVKETVHMCAHVRQWFWQTCLQKCSPPPRGGLSDNSWLCRRQWLCSRCCRLCSACSHTKLEALLCTWHNKTIHILTVITCHISAATLTLHTAGTRSECKKEDMHAGHAVQCGASVLIACCSMQLSIKMDECKVQGIASRHQLYTTESRVKRDAGDAIIK